MQSESKTYVLKVPREFKLYHRIRRDEIVWSFIIDTIMITHQRSQAVKRDYDIRMRKKIRHKNVIPLLGVYHDSINKRIALAFPMMKKGNLVAYLAYHRINDPISLVRLLFL